MRKEQYERTELTIYAFSEEDIITTSNNLSGNDQEELPPV